MNSDDAPIGGTELENGESNAAEQTPAHKLSNDAVEKILAEKSGFRLTKEMIESLIRQVHFVPVEGSTMTVCIVQTTSGFMICDSSAAIDPANYDAAVGKTVAYNKVINRLFELEGYAILRMTEEMKRGHITYTFPPAGEPPAQPPAEPPTEPDKAAT